MQSIEAPHGRRLTKGFVVLKLLFPFDCVMRLAEFGDVTGGKIREASIQKPPPIFTSHSPVASCMELAGLPATLRI